MYNEPRVSVTVPVYNTSKYLRKCLDSLKNQTLKEVEFILVDDGSTDGSGAICDEYAAKDCRFRVIHQKNGGSSVARQTGLDAAQGEYVIVCDSDDWVDPDMYQVLYDRAVETGADIICCGYFEEYPDGRSVPRQYCFRYCHGNELIREVFSCNNSIIYHSWDKMVKRDLFARSKASYKLGINQGEDALILFKLMQGCPTIAQVSRNLYHYTIDPNGSSYTNRITMSQVRQIEYIDQFRINEFPDFHGEEFKTRSLITLSYLSMRAVDTDRGYLYNLLDKLTIRNTVIATIPIEKKIAAVSAKLLPFPIVKILFEFFRRFYHK